MIFVQRFCGFIILQRSALIQQFSCLYSSTNLTLSICSLQFFIHSLVSAIESLKKSPEKYDFLPVCLSLVLITLCLLRP